MSDPVAGPIVRIEGLCKAYGRFHAVRDLSLDVQRGEILALLGPNGAGKTTTIRMLMGILSPTGGTAKVKGLDCFADRPEVMRHVGYLPDEPVFYDHLTGGEIVRFCGAMHGMPDAAVREERDGTAAPDPRARRRRSLCRCRFRTRRWWSAC
jgi:ABC-2 type transport system ATP-binding protein